MYTWNDEAADFWKDQKVLRNTVPLELNEGEIRHRDNRDSEMLILHGYLPLYDIGPSVCIKIFLRM